MTVTGEQLVRWAGLAAIGAGLIFAGIQPIHPADVLTSVTTNTWAVVIFLKWVMCFLFLIGVAGIYFRQIESAGWLGLIGYGLFSLSWLIQIGFVFTELFVLPPLASAAPQFIDSVLAIVNPASPASMDVGGLGTAYAVIGVLYLLGGIVFGVATVRAQVLPKWPAILLAVTAFVTPFAVLVPHEIQRFAAVPMGIAFIWLGYAVWAGERSATARARAVA